MPFHTVNRPKLQQQIQHGSQRTAPTAVCPILTSHHHHGHREDLLAVAGGGDVAEADGGQAGHGEVQRGDVQRVLARAALPLARAAGVVAVGRSDAESQLVEPAIHLDGVGGLVDDLVVSDAVPVGDKILISVCLAGVIAEV